MIKGGRKKKKRRRKVGGVNTKQVDLKINKTKRF
jgi:hypothetical protein